MKLTEKDKDGEYITKIASKGSKLQYDDIVKIVNGETVEWKSVAPSFSVGNGGVNFVTRKIQSTVKKRVIEPENDLPCT